MYDMYENGLRLIASAIQQKRGDEAPLTANDYGDPFKNEVFYMSAYCWCDGGVEGHEDGCPPNFSHKSGLEIRWYKYCGRCMEPNKCIHPSEWLKIVSECLTSIGAAE